MQPLDHSAHGAKPQGDAGGYRVVWRQSLQPPERLLQPATVPILQRQIDGTGRRWAETTQQRFKALRLLRIERLQRDVHHLELLLHLISAEAAVARLKSTGLPTTCQPITLKRQLQTFYGGGRSTTDGQRNSFVERKPSQGPCHDHQHCDHQPDTRPW